MPYIIKKVKNGYKLCKKNDPTKCFSKNPITKTKAKAQLKAIGMNEHLKGSGTTCSTVDKKFVMLNKLITLYEYYDANKNILSDREKRKLAQTIQRLKYQIENEGFYLTSQEKDLLNRDLYGQSFIAP